MNVVKFPYSVSRRAHARRPRWSKNGTPEERAAKAAPVAKATPAIVIELSRRNASKPALPRPLSNDELVSKMASLDQDARQFMVDYMNAILAKHST